MIQGWPRVHDPLPRPVAPALDETLRSYLTRLATANRLDADALRAYLTGDTRQSAEVNVDVLAAVSGQSTTALRYAILELSSTQPLPPTNLTRRPQPGGPNRPRCTHCTLARGHQGTAWCFHLHEDVICLRHRRWLGDGRNPDPRQVDLTRVPDVLHANQQHRRLIRRHGRRAVLLAYRHASNACQRWHRWNEHDQDFYRLMRIFHGDRWHVRATDPTTQAAQYPQLVALTRLLASPTWWNTALQHMPEPTAFITELRRTVAPYYRWTLRGYHGVRDPLVELLLEERHRLDHPNSPTVLLLKEARDAIDETLDRSAEI